MAPATTPSTTTTIELAEDPALNEWALDYVDGIAHAASGEPFRIGFASGTAADIAAAAAAVEYLNAELGGVGGRPLELEVCDATSAATLDQQSAVVQPCGQRLAADPSIHMVLIGDLFTLDTQFTDVVGASKPVYLNYGYQSSGVSFNPNGVETLAAAAQFIADELAERFDRLIAVDPVAVSPLIQRVLPDLPIIDVPIDQFEDTTLDQAVSVIEKSEATSNDLLFVQAPDCAQIVDALAVMAITPTVVAGSGCLDAAPEGWYHVNLGWNPTDPVLETGALTASVKLAEYGEPGTESFVRTFADVLTMAKIINSVGVDAASPEALRDALSGFTGVAMLARGPANCADPTVLGLPLGNCATVVDVYRRVADGWQELDPIVLNASV